MQYPHIPNNRIPTSREGIDQLEKNRLYIYHSRFAHCLLRKDKPGTKYNRSDNRNGVCRTSFGKHNGSRTLLFNG